MLKLFFCVVALPDATMSNYYSGPVVENDHTGRYDVPWGLVMNKEIRHFIFQATGVMPSLRGRNGPKKIELAGCKARLSEAFWLALAIGVRPKDWDLDEPSFLAAGSDVRGGCPQWQTHPGRSRPWDTLRNQPRLVGWYWHLRDNKWEIRPPADWADPDDPLPQIGWAPDDWLADAGWWQPQQPADVAWTMQPAAADHAALPTAISVHEADVAAAGVGPPSDDMQQPQQPAADEVALPASDLLRPVYGPHQVGRSSSCHNDEDSSRATPVFVDIRQLQQMLTRRRHPRLSPGRSNEPTEADSESKTETRREAESEPDPEAEAGAGMPVAQPVAEPVAEALPEEFPEPESVPARCDTCGATMFARSIRFAIPHQPINGKRPV